ncbi:MAG: hypothetical protein IJV62_01610 [Eggerthellaceae bacterium]|nr:hypothetical protein [Eggerthellaceae bacterium]
MMSFKKYLKSVALVALAAIVSVSALMFTGCSAGAGQGAKHDKSEAMSYMATVNLYTTQVEEQTKVLNTALSEKDLASAAVALQDMKAAYGEIKEINVPDENKKLTAIHEQYALGATSAITALSAYEDLLTLMQEFETVNSKDSAELVNQAKNARDEAATAFLEGDKLAHEAFDIEGTSGKTQLNELMDLFNGK